MEKWIEPWNDEEYKIKMAKGFERVVEVLQKEKEIEKLIRYIDGLQEELDVLHNRTEEIEDSVKSLKLKVYDLVRELHCNK